MSSWKKEEIEVHTIEVLRDNLAYILSWGEGALIVDPGDAEPILKYVKERELDVKAILNTHHHEDHVKGNLAIQQELDIRLIAPNEAIEGVDQVVSDEEEIIVGPLLIQVMATPGHTLDHVCYSIPDYSVLFSGDLLFASGCGKVLEGSFEQLFDSLQKVKNLPKETHIFCGHDYAKKNLEFGLSVEKENQAMQERLNKKDFGMPTTLEKELEANIFLRCDQASVRRPLGMEQASDLEVLTQLRKMKDAQ